MNTERSGLSVPHRTRSVGHSMFRDARIQRCLTQQALAEAAACSIGTVKRLESRRGIRSAYMKRIRAVLGL